MTMGLPRPRHGDPLETTQELRALAAAVLREDVETLARSTDYLRRSYRVVFIGYVAMMVFGVAAIVAAFVKGLTAASIGEAVASVGLAGLTVGIFVAFFVQRPSAALERNAIFMPWVSIVLTTFWTRLLYLDDPATIDAKLGHRGEGSLRRAECNRNALRRDRRQGAVSGEGGSAHAPGQARGVTSGSGVLGDGSDQAGRTGRA
jgi:hypothetical protein